MTPLYSKCTRTLTLVRIECTSSPNFTRATSKGGGGWGEREEGGGGGGVCVGLGGGGGIVCLEHSSVVLRAHDGQEFFKNFYKSSVLWL